MFLFLKRLVTPIVKTDAFKLGLINNVGIQIKEPQSDDEFRALTILDRFIFKIKRMLGGKMAQLNNFLFVQTLGNDFYNKLVVKGRVDQRAEIKRIKRDIEKLSENYDCNIQDLLILLLQEELKETEKCQSMIN